jgi:hypothetical protein
MEEKELRERTCELSGGEAIELRKFCMEKAVQLSVPGQGDVTSLARAIERYILGKER